MSNVFSTRRANVRRLMQQWGGPASLGKKLGYTSGSYLAQIAGPHPTRDLGERNAREIEQRLGLPERWLDAPHAGAPAQPDTSTLIDVVAVVRDALDAAGVQLSRARMTELVTLVYEHATNAGEVDAQYLRRLIHILKEH